MAIRASKQLASRQLDWTLSTAALFEHFANDTWAILLDSANAPHQDARFDIICANPIATLVTQGERSDIKLIDTSLIRIGRRGGKCRVRQQQGCP